MSQLLASGYDRDTGVTVMQLCQWAQFVALEGVLHRVSRWLQRHELNCSMKLQSLQKCKTCLCLCTFSMCAVCMLDGRLERHTQSKSVFTWMKVVGNTSVLQMAGRCTLCNLCNLCPVCACLW
jgi:hypothetical protein